MTAQRHILLINPTMVSRRSARFPLAVLNLSAHLDGAYRSSIVDGNIDRRFTETTLRMVGQGGVDAIGVSVMGGPQLRSAIELSQAVHARFPAVPLIWGGYFPTICAEASLRMPYVDYAVRGQGEETFAELLDAHFNGAEPERLAAIRGLSWRVDGEIRHNHSRPFSTVGLGRSLPYERLGDPRQYLGRTFLGHRTSGFQAALGCRFRCTFCGVAGLFRGGTAVPPAAALETELRRLQSLYGMDSIQFFDHNFFDREEDTLPVLEVLARLELPWWCYARADALLNLSDRAWSLIRKSRLRMAYIGAESPDGGLLREVRKGTRPEQTLEAVEICRRNNVTPELSFMLAPPHDPEGETERTFEFIRRIKRIHSATEIMLYIYAPLPPPPGAANPHLERSMATLRELDGAPLVFPQTAEEWAEPRWLSYWCHADVPWLTARLRERIRDFTTVLGCRFPTATDVRSPRWGRVALRALSSWRYSLKLYGRPWELDLSRRLIRLWDPRLSGL